MLDSVRLSLLLPGPFAAARPPVRDVDVNALCYDSRRVAPGSVFFALRGVQADGHGFIDEAVARGAVAVVMEESRDLPEAVAGLVVPDSRAALAAAARIFYGDPSAAMQVVGVTGTNGKTTTTWLLESILSAAGHHPAVFGTVNYRLGERALPAPHTTPEAVEMLQILREFRDQGADSLVLEVSSHALEQHRADGIHFSVGVFTNLTPEHLDYHGDMESYFAGKKRLFTHLLPRDGGRAVIHVGDDYGRRLAAEVPGALTCGVDARADVRPVDMDLSLEGIRGKIRTPEGMLEIESALLGQFNLENLLCAVAAATALGLPPQAIEKGIRRAPQVPGRLEQVVNQRGAVILVDYAHTGDALEKALAAVRRLQPRRVITVFGCGGDRDPGKRPVMGEVAARLSDLVILTSDNPRTENPQGIIDQIVPGLRRGNAAPLTGQTLSQDTRGGYVIEADRRRAIGLAVSLLAPGDLLLVAGKGHENYQIVGGERLHFDDREEVQRALGEQEVS
ncbi:UDP-N-acetylmuramoyl-L-alanyl-D-glutamate--2,6-diaminopimelate ligase [Geoalkalibacter halelectricus]|uniref:UDP-N-acetylmuramoyl-L-alanyl-D-glutamate--2,6-diaminopimelate ligase n=1 Tax=Geoalkalibacter halelectricus TaxID=2847045 RepID=A0ABY5ZLY7_9BACT|nr:UDP-N-acetylmuramoyl-L-alanyl-D-glutamate--2,6-diaminopimelate ligase [Geoalkalibacter halelectricus]MDO3378825.1 UDP-N-acetylmuramoyl-L-alanyl-D-glutamate--2,6-diaminopimelate ligase [Geoalkalibacter halelectricus]UWZ79869.1 UDP-N-acetylmuramoyl-L-alanyl-D-glutamate--2,6-diaminopimelate ligase [Geoalkalibacter halelectricus]